MSRPVPKVSWMLVEPTVLVEVISSTSAIAPRCRSSGVAMLLAMTSGLAPGSAAVTNTAGRSMRGSGATGRRVNAAAPEQAMPSVSRIVATGRAMNGAEMFMATGLRGSRRGVRERVLAGSALVGRRIAAPEALREPVERQVDHGRRVEGEQLAHEEASDDRHSERTAQLRARAGSEHQRQR